MHLLMTINDFHALSKRLGKPLISGREDIAMGFANDERFDLPLKKASSQSVRISNAVLSILAADSQDQIFMTWWEVF